VKYFAIIFFMSLFVVAYVWQNIEIVQIEMQYKKLADTRKRLVRERDRLLYEIERFRRMDVIEEYARKNGLRPVVPGDFDVVKVDARDGR
jgi:hypothetical protein